MPWLRWGSLPKGPISAGVPVRYGLGPEVCGPKIVEKMATTEVALHDSGDMQLDRAAAQDPLKRRSETGGRGAWLAVLLGAVLSAGIAAGAPVEHRQSDEPAEVAILIRRGTADALATASLLTYLIETRAQPAPPELLERAIALAPRRPELIWLQLRECQQRQCPEELQIARRLRELDPDNGLAGLAELRAAQHQSADDVTQAILKMSAGSSPRIYWNRLTVMMFDALTHRDPAQPPTAITRHADDRLSHVTGVLASVAVPAFKPLAAACRKDRVQQPERQAACVALMARFDASDAVITQNVRLSVQAEWWPAGTPEGDALRRDLLERRYCTVASNRLRKGHADSDAQLRVDAMRHLEREQDVERAMLQAFHDPLERPADWREPEVEN